MRPLPVVRVLTLLAAAAAVAPVAAAQSASMVVEVEVADIRMVANMQRSISFGEVPPGRGVTIDPRLSPEAGVLEIAATAGTEFHLAMEMPERLEALATGATLRMEFGAVARCGADGDCRDVAADGIRGSSRPTGAGRVVQLRLGGTVESPEAQPPGMYQGTAVASLAYTAN
jgi:hypothetical protein